MRKPLDDLDKCIIRELQKNGRTTNLEISRKLSVSEGTVRKRLERLVQSRVLQIVGVVDPFKIGYSYYTNIELKVELSKIEAVSDTLARMREVSLVGITAGAYDVFATAAFRSSEEFMGFITNKLAKIPGILGIQTSQLLNVKKREYTWRLEGAQAPGRMRRPRAGTRG